MSVAASYGGPSGELADAYPRLKREFIGKIIRLESSRRSGLSDFILVRNGLTTFTEVKGVTTDCVGVPITAPQCEFLDDVDAHGGRARLLVLCNGEWWVGEPPFYTKFMLQQRTIYDLAPRRLLDVNNL